MNGYRDIVAWSSSVGCKDKDVVVEIIKVSVRKWGHVGLFIVSFCTYVATLTVPMITNITRIVRAATTAHTTIACAAE